MGFQQGSIRHSDADIVIKHLGSVDYQQTWDLQALMARQRAEGDILDTLLMLEHPAVYTAGKRTQPEDMPTNGLPVVTVDRGGRITWHGPGQLVAYPIIKLADPVDVVDYVRRLEEAAIRTCRDFGVDSAGRVEGRSGVWLPAGVVDGELRPSRKISAIGIRVTRGVTMHGLSLNCTNTLDYYDHIVACGISDAGTTTLAREIGQPVDLTEVQGALEQHIVDALNGRLELS